MPYSLTHKQTTATDLVHQNIHLNVYLSEIGIFIGIHLGDTVLWELRRDSCWLKNLIWQKNGRCWKDPRVSLSLFAYAYQLRQDQSKQSQTQYMREKQKWADQKRQRVWWGVEKDPSQSWILIKTPCTFR